MRRRAIAIGCGVTLMVLASPAVSPDEVDSFPVSNYPMFARPRSALTTFDTVELVDDSGARRRLDVREISGTDQPMQAAMTLQQAIRTHSTESLCEQIAARLDSVGRVELLTVEYDAVGWFRSERHPVDVRVRATCESGRP